MALVVVVELVGGQDLDYHVGKASYVPVGVEGVTVADGPAPRQIVQAITEPGRMPVVAGLRLEVRIWREGLQAGGWAWRRLVSRNVRRDRRTGFR